MRNDIEEVYDNDTNRLAAVQVGILHTGIKCNKVLVYTFSIKRSHLYHSEELN